MLLSVSRTFSRWTQNDEHFPWQYDLLCDASILFIHLFSFTIFFFVPGTRMDLRNGNWQSMFLLNCHTQFYIGSFISMCLLTLHKVQSSLCLLNSVRSVAGEWRPVYGLLCFALLIRFNRPFHIIWDKMVACQLYFHTHSHSH